MNKQRDTRFEVMRIISMIFIIMAHYNLYGNWSVNTVHDFKMKIFEPWGQVGVYLFVMITGYFMSNKALNLRLSFLRNKKLWVKTIFYSWIILILTLIFNSQVLNLKQVIFAIFPVVFGEYWFITSYIVLIFFLPVLNLMVYSCKRNELKMYIGIIIVVADIMPYIGDIFNAPLGGGLSMGSMLAPYLIAAYIKKYNINLNNFNAIIITISGLFLEYLSVFIMSKYSNNAGRFTAGILPLIVGVGIFLLFLNLKPFYSRIINWIASGVLASYLITEHSLLRLTFWHKILNVSKYQNPFWMFVLMGIVIAFITVISGSIIDHLYEWGYNKIFTKKKY